MDGQVKFYLDEHVHTAVAAGLRRRGIDVLTTQDASTRSAGDGEQLAMATREGRVLFTQDVDFLRIHATDERRAGIVFARQRTDVGHIVCGLYLISQAFSAEDMENRVEFL